MKHAVVLAAGNGDRFLKVDHHSKLLHPVAGRPLILRTLETAAAAGISSFCVVLGFEAERVRAAITAEPIPGTHITFVHNPDWHLENGVSALAARDHCPARFALLMGDHLFDPLVLRRMLALDLAAEDSVLAVDFQPADPALDQSHAQGFSCGRGPLEGPHRNGQQGHCREERRGGQPLGTAPYEQRRQAACHQQRH